MPHFYQELLSALGMNINDTDVKTLIFRHELLDLYDDPPFRQYVGSDEKGVDLLLDDGRVVDVQFHVTGSATRSAFAGELPLGLQSGMTQADVHALLGNPDKFDTTCSQYQLPDMDAKLSASFNRAGILEYISVGLPLS